MKKKAKTRKISSFQFTPFTLQIPHQFDVDEGYNDELDMTVFTSKWVDFLGENFTVLTFSILISSVI